MPKPYSEDLRKRILQAAQKGQRFKRIAKKYDVSQATVYRWVKEKRETGRVQAKQSWQKGHSAKIVDLKFFRDFVLKHQGFTLKELAKLWHEPISTETIRRAMKKIGFSRKKKVTLT